MVQITLKNANFKAVLYYWYFGKEITIQFMNRELLKVCNIECRLEIKKHLTELSDLKMIPALYFKD